MVGRLGPVPADRRCGCASSACPPAPAASPASSASSTSDCSAGPGGRLLAGTWASTRAAAPGAAGAHDTGARRAARGGCGTRGRLGGVVALGPRSGQILAFAGIGFPAFQPPGSTFKIITLTGALEARLTGPGSRYPVQTEAVLEGVALENANGESCGGSLRESFAESCNSVFALAGARLGARRLVDVAERFGFNSPPGIVGAAT